MTEDEILKLPYRPCVGIMLCNAQGGIFAGQRLDSAQDAWQMPQGGVEQNEDPKAAALRELEEETGIPPFAVEVIAETQDWIPYELPHYLVKKLWNGKYRGQKQRWFLMQFIGSTLVGERLAPRVRIPLEPSYFQQKLFEREGESVLFDNNDFQEYFNGLVISIQRWTLKSRRHF